MVTAERSHSFQYETRSAHRRHSNVSTDYSSSSDGKKTKKRKMTSFWICLLIVLLIVALVIAILLGLLVYFLVRNKLASYPSDGSVATTSLRLLNQPYSDKMLNTTSPEFNKVGGPVCEEMDKFFKGNSEMPYIGCKVNELRADHDVPPCKCPGLLQAYKQGSVRAFLELTFRGRFTRGELNLYVPSVLERKVNRIKQNNLYLLVMNNLYIIGIQSALAFKSTQTTTITVSATISPQVPVYFYITVGLYDFHYLSEVKDKNSWKFRELEFKFCRDIDNFFRHSQHDWKYEGCAINNYWHSPTELVQFKFHLIFSTTSKDQMKGTILDILSNKARHEYREHLLLLLIGDLKLVWDAVDVSSTSPSTSVMSSTATCSRAFSSMITSSTAARETILASIYCNVYNQSLPFESVHMTTSGTILLEKAFCSEIHRIYDNSPIKCAPMKCSIAGYSKVQSRITFHLLIEESSTKYLDDLLIQMLERNARKIIIRNVYVMDVGGIFLLSKTCRASVKYIDDTDCTPSVSATIHTERLTSTSDISASSTPMTTFKPTPTLTMTSTGVSGITTQVAVTANLYGFAYSYDLTDRNSWRFRQLEKDFCKDIELFFMSSSLKNVYSYCTIENFRPVPDQIVFKLTFSSIEDELSSKVLHILRSRAPHHYIQRYHLILVGKIKIIWASVRVIFDTTLYSTLVVTRTVPEHSMMTSLSVYPSTLAKVYCGLFNQSLPFDINDRTSVGFLQQQRNFCSHIQVIYRHNPLTASNLNCYITNYRPNPPSILFHVVVGEYPSQHLKNLLLTVLHNNSPRDVINHVDTLEVGGLFLISHSCRVTLELVNYTQSQSYFPTLYTTSTKAVSITLTPTPTSSVFTQIITSSSHSGLTYIYITVSLYGFSYSNDLANRYSVRFKRLEERFCTDVDGFFERSSLRGSYADCRIDEFRPSPDMLVFHLVFSHIFDETIEKLVLHVLSTTAIRVKIDWFDLLLVGDLKLIWDTINVIETSHWITVVPTQTPTTHSVSISTTPVPVYPSTLAVFVCHVYNKTFPFPTDDTSNKGFLYQQKKFCSDLEHIYRQSPLTSVHWFCHIIEYRTDPIRVHFIVAIQELPSQNLQRLMVSLLESNAKHRFIHNTDALDIGGLFLLSQTCVVSLKPFVNNTNGTSYFPTLTHTTTLVPSATPTITPTPTILTSIMTTVTSTSAGVTYVYITVGLYGFAYSFDLANHLSIRFRKFESNFCKDVDGFFRRSNLRDSYSVCSIDEFRPSPDTLVFNLIFSRIFDKSFQTVVLHILGNTAPHEKVNWFDLLLVGDLKLIWDTIKLYVTSVGSTVLPTPTQTSLPSESIATTQVPLYPSTLAVFLCHVYNKTLPFPTDDTTDSGFLYQQKKFCSAMEHIYRHSPVTSAYMKCYIVNYSIVPMRVRFHMVIGESPSQYLQTLMLTLLESNAKHQFIYNIDTLDIGGLYLLSQSCSVSLKRVNYTESTSYFPSLTPTVATTLTPTPTLFPSVTTTLTSTSVSKEFTIFYIGAGLYGFAYSFDLSTKKSWRFRRLEDKFCTDIDVFFQTSSLQANYKECRIDLIRSSPDFIKFHLLFSTLFGEETKSTIMYILGNRAPHMHMGQLDLLVIGDLNLIWDTMDITVTITVPGPTPTPTIQPSSTAIFSSKIIYSSTLVILFCNLYNTTFSFDTTDRTSHGFLRQQQKFCSDIQDIYRHNPMTSAYQKCYITDYRTNPTGIEFHVVIGEPLSQYLKTFVLALLENRATHHLINNIDTFEVGDLFLMSQTCRVTLKPVNYTDSASYFSTSSSSMTNTESATLTPTPTIVPTPTSHVVITSLVPDYCSLNPCKNGGLCVTGSTTVVSKGCTIGPTECPGGFCRPGISSCHGTVLPFYCICQQDWTGQFCNDAKFVITSELLNITWTADLADNSTVLYKHHSKSFCEDIETLISTHSDRLPPLQSCRIIRFLSDPMRIEWEIVFKGHAVPGTDRNVVGLLQERFKRARYADSLGSVVGDLLIFMFRYTTTPLVMNRRLLNFTWTTDLLDSNSKLFQHYQRSVCTVLMSTIIKFPGDFRNITSCKVGEFLRNPPRIVFELRLPGYYLQNQLSHLEVIFSENIHKHFPNTRYENMIGYYVGDLFFYYQDYFGLFEVKIEFRALNLTWSEALADITSTEYTSSVGPIQSEIEYIMRDHPKHFPVYHSCSVTKLTASRKAAVVVEVTFFFTKSVDVKQTQRRTTAVILENTKAAMFNGGYVHLIGGYAVPIPDLRAYKH